MNQRKLWDLLPRFTPILAVLLALLVGAVMLAILGTNPWEAYRALFIGAFGSTNALADTIVKATPLLFVGLGICIAFRGGVLNIGGEGQLVTGAIAATALALAIPTWPGWLIILVSLFAGMLAGAIWGGIAGLLKAHFNVNEILSTIMLNYIAVFGMNYLLRGPMMDPLQIKLGSFTPQTARLPRAADLPRLIPTRLHLGAAIAVVLAVAVYVLLWRTTIGFRIRTVGKNLRAALAAGIRTKRYMALSLVLAGAFAGLGGAVEVLGLHHRMFTDGSAFGFTGSAGFNGIVAALFGQLHPIGTIPASFFLGALLTGANKMQRVMQVPSALIGALNGLIVLLVVGSEIFRRRQMKHTDKLGSEQVSAADTKEEP
ncbi:MAG TPA: ABC transporter permease [Candidatus Acetothermia bacterium]|nr:ABC transporter permease [Candidatus Acetothermia bacterium]